MRHKFKEQLDQKGDGRNVDANLGVLMGEGAGQKIQRLEEGFPTQPAVLRGEPSKVLAERQDYYGLPAIKEPVWIWTIPAYFYVGGVTGAAGALAGAAQFSGDGSLRPLVRRLRWLSAVGSVVSGALLVYDLGRPARFLNMLRVFRVSSPMSIGSWLLAGVGASSATAAVLGEFEALPPARRVADVAGLANAALCLPFAGYTAVLVTNTAVPLWQSVHKSLPKMFMASSVVALSSALQLMNGLSPREQRIANRFGIAGKVAELYLSKRVEQDARVVPEVARPLEQGRSGALWKTAKWMNVASLALSLLPERMRWARRAAGVLGTASSLTMRYAVMEAGRASARNPQAVFQQQRQGHGAAEAGPASNLVQLKIEGRPIAHGV